MDSAAVAVSLVVAPAGVGNTMAMTLDDLVRDVRAAAGDAVLAVVLYGSAAGRDYHGPGSDQNVLVLMQHADVALLRALAASVRRWVGVGNPPPLLLTLAEWRQRADVFAIEYADLLERHRVLFGAFPTESVVVAPEHLRIQIESEAMGKLLRFRRGVMSAGDDVTRLRGLIDDAFPPMQALLRAVLHLHGESADLPTEQVIARASALTGVRAAPFQSVLAHRRGTARLSDQEVAAVAEAYLEQLQALVNYADAFAPA